MIGRSSRDGVPGGSSSYGTSRRRRRRRANPSRRVTGGATNDAGLIVEDRERDRGRRRRWSRSGAVRGRGVELARAQHCSREQDDRASAEEHAQRDGAAPAERNEPVSCVSTPGAYSVRACDSSSLRRAPLPRAGAFLELTQLFLERGRTRLARLFVFVEPGSGRRPGARACRLASPSSSPALGEHLGDELERAALVSRTVGARSVLEQPERLLGGVGRSSGSGSGSGTGSTRARGQPTVGQRPTTRQQQEAAADQERQQQPRRGAVRRSGHVGDVQPPRLGIGASLGTDPLCARSTGRAACSAPRPPARFWNSTRAGRTRRAACRARGRRAASGSAARTSSGCASSTRASVRVTVAGPTRRHGSKPTRTLDAVRIDMAQVDGEVDLRARGVAEDDNPVGERRRARRGRIVDSPGVVRGREERRPARSCERDEDERRRPPRAGRSRYATTAAGAANSFQSRGAEHVEGSLDESSTGSRSSRVSFLQQRQRLLLIGAAPAQPLLLRQADVGDPAAARVAQRDDDPADVGKALLPDRILDHNRYDVQRCSTAVSQVSREGGSRKSEKRRRSCRR